MNIKKVLLTCLIALAFLGSLAGAGAAGELSESSAVPTPSPLVFTEPVMADVLSDAPAIVHRSLAIPTAQALIRSAAISRLSGVSGLENEQFIVGETENKDATAWQLSGAVALALGQSGYQGEAGQALARQAVNPLSGTSAVTVGEARVLGATAMPGAANSLSATAVGAALDFDAGDALAFSRARDLAGASVLSKEALLFGDTENKDAATWTLAGTSMLADEVAAQGVANPFSGVATFGVAGPDAAGDVMAWRLTAGELAGAARLSKDAILIGDTGNKDTVAWNLAGGWPGEVAVEGMTTWPIAADWLSGAAVVDFGAADDHEAAVQLGAADWLSGAATLDETPATGAKAEARVAAQALAGGSILSKEAHVIGDTENKDNATTFADPLSGDALLRL